jgi:hypothetical protein
MWVSVDGRECIWQGGLVAFLGARHGDADCPTFGQAGGAGASVRGAMSKAPFPQISHKRPSSMRHHSDGIRLRLQCGYPRMDSDDAKGAAGRASDLC